MLGYRPLFKLPPGLLAIYVTLLSFQQYSLLTESCISLALGEFYKPFQAFEKYTPSYSHAKVYSISFTWLELGQLSGS